MRSFRVLLTFIVGHLLSQQASAQVFTQSGFGVQSGVGFGVSRHHVRFSGFYGRSSFSSVAYGSGFGFSPGFLPAPTFVPGLYPIAPILTPFGPIFPAPAFVPQPFFFPPVIVPPPIVVIPPTVFVLPPNGPIEPVVDFQPRNDVPQVDPAKFEVIRPRNRAIPKGDLAGMDNPLMKRAIPPLATEPIPDPNPEAESKRQLQLAQDAFSQRLYGRAADRAMLALDALPMNAEAAFLLAQARFAMGDFTEAVRVLDTAMRTHPDWRNRPDDLNKRFGAVPDLLAGRIQELRSDLANQPNDPALLFLLGHQLWFSGDREAASLFFRRAIKLVDDPSMIDKFLPEANAPMRMVQRNGIR